LFVLLDQQRIFIEGEEEEEEEEEDTEM